MSRLTRLEPVIQKLLRPRIGAVVVMMLVLLTGCRSESDSLAPSAAQNVGAPDLDLEFARAASLRNPIFVLLEESGLSREDDRARRLLESLSANGKLESVVPIVLDLSVSRNRASAARFHATNTPVLLGLSPRGLIVTRDEGALTKDLVLKRISEVTERGNELDLKLATLEAAIARDGNDASAQWALADFLLAQKNDREAISHLEFVAHDEAADIQLRIRAWVELARAHVWIAEAEKARHEANALVAILGPKTGEARAGGELVLGIQDANAKRVALARRELEAAVAAAPKSIYGKHAAEVLATLQGDAK